MFVTNSEQNVPVLREQFTHVVMRLLYVWCYDSEVYGGLDIATFAAIHKHWILHKQIGAFGRVVSNFPNFNIKRNYGFT